jgi:hypothetical protein
LNTPKLTILTRQTESPVWVGRIWCARTTDGLHSGKGRTQAEAIGRVIESMAQVGAILIKLDHAGVVAELVREGGAA